MRTAPPTIEAMLDAAPAEPLTLSKCVKIVLRDGFEFGFTDHDNDLVVQLDNDLYESLTYKANGGLRVNDIDLAVGLDADNTDISVPFTETLGRAALLARRFNQAKVYIFDADWTQTVPLPLELMAGIIADARAERHMAVFEVRSQADYWNTVVGSILSPMCRADFGDAKCGATPTNTAATVTAVSSNMRFNIDLVGVADDFWRFGTAEFMTGELAGTWPYEIVAYTGASKEVEVLSPMPGFPEVGDTLLLRDGCSRLKSLPDDLSMPTCATHNNVVRFRGFDRVPGTDRYLRPPIPGEGNQ